MNDLIAAIALGLALGAMIRGLVLLIHDALSK